MSMMLVRMQLCIIVITLFLLLFEVRTSYSIFISSYFVIMGSVGLSSIIEYLKRSLLKIEII